MVNQFLTAFGHELSDPDGSMSRSRYRRGTGRDGAGLVALGHSVLAVEPTGYLGVDLGIVNLAATRTEKRIAARMCGAFVSAAMTIAAACNWRTPAEAAGGCER